jgi:hypothetical protein
LAAALSALIPFSIDTQESLIRLPATTHRGFADQPVAEFNSELIAFPTIDTLVWPFSVYR